MFLLYYTKYNIKYYTVTLPVTGTSLSVALSVFWIVKMFVDGIVNIELVELEPEIVIGWAVIGWAIWFDAVTTWNMGNSWHPELVFLGLFGQLWVSLTWVWVVIGHFWVESVLDWFRQSWVRTVLVRESPGFGQFKLGQHMVRSVSAKILPWGKTGMVLLSIILILLFLLLVRNYFLRKKP